MTVEVFDFCPRINPEGVFNQRSRSVQLGDGYTQRFGDGINSESQSWPLTFVGDLTYIQPIMAFLRRHKGYIAFQWENPLTEVGLYCCPDEITLPRWEKTVVTSRCTGLPQPLSPPTILKIIKGKSCH